MNLIETIQIIRNSNSENKWDEYAAAINASDLPERHKGFLDGVMSELGNSHNSNGQDFGDELFYSVKQLLTPAMKG